MVASFIPWQKTSLSRSCCHLVSLFQKDLGRELMPHQLSKYLLSFWSVFLFTEGVYPFFPFYLEPVRFLHCSLILVFEQLETRRNALSTISFPTDGPALAPQPCKGSANSAQQNIEQPILLCTVMLPNTSLDSYLSWMLTLGATTFHWDCLLQTEYFLEVFGRGCSALCELREQSLAQPLPKRGNTHAAIC